MEAPDPRGSAARPSQPLSAPIAGPAPTAVTSLSAGHAGTAAHAEGADVARGDAGDLGGDASPNGRGGDDGNSRSTGGVHMVVVHHDRPDTCARTVAAFEALAEVTSVCVVDSSSHAAASDRLRELLPAADIIDAGGNVGFGPGANLGLRRWLEHGSGHWVGVAPHDALPAPDAIARILHETRSRPDAGLVSAEFGPEFALLPVFDKVMGGFYRATQRGSGWQDVDYPHGTLLLARRELLDDIGLFDERYFAYCEEVDLGLRARDAGWAVGLVWGAIVVNGRLPPRLLADYLQLRNTLLLVHSRQGPREVRARVILALAAMIARPLRLCHRPFRLRRTTIDRRRPTLDARRATVRLRLERRALLDYRHRRFGPPPPEVVALARRYEETAAPDVAATGAGLGPTAP